MKNITENNKLIAEFMGFKIGKGDAYSNNKKLKYWYYLPKNHWYFDAQENEIIKEFFPNENKFHSDWNWIVEVVKKIEKTTIRETHGQFNENECEATISVSIENTFCQILSNGAFLNEITSINGESKIEAVYSACVEFVKWYNENK